MIKIARIDIALACVAGLVALMGLSACALDTPSNLSPNRMQVQPDQFFEQVALDSVDQNYVDGMIFDYTRQGNGTLDLTVAYDPASRAYGAAKAQKKANALKNMLSGRSLKDVRVSALPVKDLGDEAHLVVSYPSLKALPPRDCALMSGIDDQNLVTDEQYRFGCSLDTALARQVRPKDLAGRDAGDVMNDGRRNANVVEIYRTGVPNQPLEGESASK